MSRLDRRGFLGLSLGGLAALGSAPLREKAHVGKAERRGAAERPEDRPYALVLGSVQDGGLPQVGCYTERCERARRQPRYVTSLLLVDPATEAFYLVDASPDITRQLDLVNLPAFRARAAARRPFDGIFLTHAHIGHYTGLAQLGREGLGMAPTPCYCTAAMAAFLRENGPWSLLVSEGRLDLQILEPEREQELGPRLSVRALPVPHRHVYSDTVGFEIGGPAARLLYLPDIDRWEDWDRDVETVVAGVSVALLDGAFYAASEVPGRDQRRIPHPLIPHTMDRLQGLVGSDRRIVFTHLNNTNPALDEGSPERAEVLRRGFEIAREGEAFAL
ncbi:MAG: MBL fold metallo-hydrolase [Gemmatimonadota bacterium]